MLLGLLRDGLVTQLSHAGYLGEELAKAQTALQFNLRYDQDRPLRSGEIGAQSTVRTEIVPSKPTTPTKPPSKPMTLKELEDMGPSETVDLGFNVTETPAEGLLDGIFLEMDEAEPFVAYHRTDKRLQIQWTPAAKIVMGASNEIHPGALLRVLGKRGQDQTVTAEVIVILTRAARIIE